ncbi:B3/4 domain-containing protein [Caldivirga maquilingensis]|uniref:B3/4 domain protein n=1 Tax=Caldivirga maquilingensis (strain ATCC 700844 / DSM 13496 / JCM 10307 / IC-167) TaxID=397948 RepID=A8ME22_CALMQ|nr:phenylalanine--tRNA ligase beta subunit-related protein [Caldivirga maquilingensis]ABW02028.1 B3/4 domain protein [Caldivirga maquilingensis IC-167]
MRIFIHSSLSDLELSMAVGVVVGINNRVNSPELSKIISDVEDDVRKTMSIESLKNDELIRLYRNFYWRLGIDPTKQRPAQEALIRRILKGDGLPRINPLVDIGNVASVKYKVPVGLYDLRKIGQVDYIVLRRAADGELFTPLGSPKMELTRNQIVLATNDGRILHVYPYRDSELTKVDEFTSDVLIIVAGIRNVNDNVLFSALSEIEALCETLLNGKVLTHGLVNNNRSLDFSIKI